MSIPDTSSKNYDRVQLYLEKEPDLDAIMAGEGAVGLVKIDNGRYQKSVPRGMIGVIYDPSNKIHQENVENAAKEVLLKKDIGYTINFMLLVYYEKEGRETFDEERILNEFNRALRWLCARLEQSGQRVTPVYSGSPAHRYINFPGEMPHPKKHK